MTKSFVICRRNRSWFRCLNKDSVFFYQTIHSFVEDPKVSYTLYETVDISVDSLKVPHILYETTDSSVDTLKVSQFS
jgi:hypothetical protein